LKYRGAFFLVLCLLSLSLATETVFKDVPDDHWANPAINNVVQLGITRGYSDGTFKGEKLVNRYEMMVFLSNLSISLEKIMDEKLEQAILSDGGNFESRILEELKLEIEKLKEQLAAVKGQGSAYSYKTTSSLDWKVSGDFTSQHFEYTAAATNPVLVHESARKIDCSRITVRALKEFENSKLEIDLDSDWQTWRDSDIMSDWNTGAFAAKYTTNKQLSDTLSLEMFLSTGPGDYLLNNQQVVFRFHDSMGFKLSLWELDYQTYLQRRSSTVERTKHGLSYRLKDLGMFSSSKIYFEFDNYYEIVSPNRLNTRSTIGADVYLTSKYLFRTKVITEYSPATEWKSSYTEARFDARDLIKNKMHLALMYAVIGKDFDSNAVFNEEIESVNFSGFRVGNYFTNYWGNDLMPTADIKTESGLKLWGKFTDTLGGHLTYITGLGLGDPDDDLKKDTSYSYTMASLGLFYELTKSFQIRLNYANNILKQKDIDDDLLNEKVTRFYFTGRF